MAERLLEHGMPVEPDNYDALYACVSNQAVGAAKLLLDRGIDLEQYQLWAEHRPKGDGYTETMEELAAYWSELQNSTQPEDSPMKGIRTQAEKKEVASAWLELAISCAKVPVKYEADEIKRRQKEEKTQRETEPVMA